MDGRRLEMATAAVVLALTVLLSGCGSSSGATSVSPTDGQALVNSLCIRCHPIGRVQAARKNRAAWTATVNRMMSHGLQVTDQQAQAIVDYLTKRDGG